MNRTEHNTKITSPGVGFFAMLGDLLSRRGSGALSLALSRPHARLALAATLALAASLALAGILWVGSSPAVASPQPQPHAFLIPFGSAGTGAGQFMLGAESGAAVDQSTGDVYIADTGNHRVDEFTASGMFIHAFGWGVANGGAEPQTCTTTTTCLAGIPGPGAGQFEAPNFVAVDNTPGGGGDLYVADDGSVANARQTITVNATGGSYTLSYASFVHATTASGSPLVTAVSGPWGVGQPISGPGIPPGATIAHSVSPTSFELSASATASGRAVLTVTRGTTVPIAYIAPAKGEGSVEAALGALTGTNGVGEAFARVTGKAGGPYTVEFVEVLAATSVPGMTADSSGLTGGTATATVAVEVEGKNTARVQKFDPAGGLVTGWGGTPAPGELDGTSCTEECASHFGEVYGVGVKPDGKLLVLDFHTFGDSVNLFEAAQSSGEFIEEPSPLGDGAPIGVALDPAGRLYLGRIISGSHPPYEVLQTSQCDSFNSLGPCFEPQPHHVRFVYHENFRLTKSSPAVGVAVDPATEEAYVARFNPVGGSSDVIAYDSEGAFAIEEDEAKSSFGGHGEVTEARGIAVSGSTSDVYVVDRGAGRVEIFAPSGPRATLTVTRTGTSLGSVASQPAGIACPSTCSSSFPEGEEVTLTAAAPEHSSFVGWSGGGCSGAGPCRVVLAGAVSVTATFAQDRPALITDPASLVTRHTAMLTGTVDPEGDASSCVFEYGVTGAYGAQAPCASHPGSGAAPVAVGAQLWELAASTTYHYRLVSANTGGATYGPDGTFTTLPEGCAVNSALCPVFALVQPPATVAVVPPKPPATTTTRTLTNAQKLTRALKACRKQKRRSARVSCERQARKRYPPARKKAKKSTRNRKRG
jgi:Divergent InlB B-repeat domain/NHL repeat